MTIPSRAGTAGALLTVTASGATVGLGTLTVAAWPGTGLVATEQALVTVLLGAATMGAAWVTAVLALATASVLRVGTDEVAPPATASSRPVRRLAALLLALAGATGSPAVASAVPTDDALAAAASSAPAAASSAAGTPTTAVPTTDVAAGGAAVVDAAAVAPGDRSSDGSGTVRPGVDVEGRAVPQPGWTPTPPAPRPGPSAEVGLVTTVPRETLPDRVVVHRGDTLWDLCARHLGPQATNADIAQEWPRWYAANEDLIGPDPDLILPGQELVVPEREPSR